MTTFKNVAAMCAIACGLTLQAGNAAAVITPVADFGNVAPPISDQFLDVTRNGGPAPWYVHFNLQTEANVTLGVGELPPAPNGTSFSVLGAQLYDMDGNFLKPGTDTIEHNPFSEPIKHLVADLGQHPWGQQGVHLFKGDYLLGVSGDGNRHNSPFNDLPDFRVHLQVMPIPEPETYALMLAGLGLVGFMARRRQRA